MSLSSLERENKQKWTWESELVLRVGGSISTTKSRENWSKLFLLLLYLLHTSSALLALSLGSFSRLLFRWWGQLADPSVEARIEKEVFVRISFIHNAFDGESAL
jgi:hypothetical protein